MTEPYRATEADDRRFMLMALNQAEQAAARGEIPIGAIIVSDAGRVVGRGHNLTESLADVTAHAEMQAITAAAQTLGGKYLQGCTLYVTVEPCLMCAGAIAWAQIGRIVYAADDPKRGYRTYTPKPFHPRATVVSGVLADRASELMKNFFSLCRDSRR